jgi:hypothetical protein
MWIILEFIQVIAPVIAILIAASTVLQTLERARRELAVNLIYNWAKDTHWVESRAINVAKELPKEVIADIYHKRGASITGEHYDGIMSILRGGNFSDLPPQPCHPSAAFQINPEHSAFIHYQWAIWLNRLEGILAAWQQGAADLTLMEDEFAPLVKGSSAELEVLEIFREGLPIITAFYYQQKETGRIKVRPRLGIFPWRF